MADAIDHHLERLDHLQSIVQRLAGNSFLIKGWAVTLVSAILGFALKDAGATAQLAYLALVPILLFWGLDGYYLAAERQIRDLYNDGAAALHAVSSSSTAPALPDPRLDLLRSVIIAGLAHPPPLPPWCSIFFSPSVPWRLPPAHSRARQS
jgi:hypothetical protein